MQDFLSGTSLALGNISLEPFYQLLLAAFLGGMLGVERELVHKPAGVRTYSLVGMGSALFTILSIDGFNGLRGSIDPTRIAAQVVVGVGFLGAGMIYAKGDKIQGITTAAGIWVAAAIGMTVGLKLYALALFAAVLSLIILIVFWVIEERIIKSRKPWRHHTHYDDHTHDV
ncbi:MAG: MgtC/SapB family protein [Parcubacteria group bacterium]|nr:MgtC/SapB family protein [Parcubacteria group bacterium]